MQKNQKFNTIEEFTLLYKLGEGSFSNVFLGVHNKTQKKFAIKKIDTSNLNTLHSQNLHKEIEIHS